MSELHSVETVIDNGAFGTRSIRFETGVLAQQAAGSVSAFLDDDTMLLSATTAGMCAAPRGSRREQRDLP